MVKHLALILVICSTSLNAQILWQFDSNGLPSGKPAINKKHVYFANGQNLFALDKQGRKIWHFELGADSYSNLLLADKKLFVLAENGLHAFDLSGNRKWFYAIQDKPLLVEGETWGWGKGQFVDPWAWYRSSPVLVGDKVIFGSSEGTIAVSKETGKLLWKQNTGFTHTQAAVHNNIVVVGSWDNHLYGLNHSDGSVVWKFSARLPQGKHAGWQGWRGFNLSPVIHQGVVYVGSRGTYFYAIEAQTGIEQWSSKHASSWVGSAAVVSEGNVYYGMSDGLTVVGQNALSGNRVLTFNTRFLNFAQPQVDKKHVYFANLAGEVYSIEKLSGATRKLFSSAASQMNYADVVKSGGGLKYKYSVGDNYSHENMRKDILRMFSKLDSVLTLTLDDGILYIGTANGHLLALKL